MRCIVLDLEMNQPSNLIIQIGACVVDLKARTIVKEFLVTCNPGELPSEYITNLTGITPEQVAAGPSLQDALTSFWAWCEEQKLGMELAAWGGDVNWIIDASKAAGVAVPRRVQNLNIKQMAKVFRSAITKRGVKKSGGLKNTMQTFEMQFEGAQHNALVDAVNTAKLLLLFRELVRVGIETKDLVEGAEREIQPSPLSEEEKVPLDDE